MSPSAMTRHDPLDDFVMPSSSAEAKQVIKTRDDQVHICYCHTPIRYYWSHYDEYRK